ncbi:MAG: T9SS type A sorting domain-containing protein [Bacteroidetes bacterium]|nr:T9SS type A sorting domain-containing protein [Bacteroidota bacterium]
MIRTLLILISLLFVDAVALRAEIRLSAPAAQTVFQRNQRNEGVIRVHGTCTLPYTRLEARLVSWPTPGTEPAAWVALAMPPGQGTFHGDLTARGGWYTLEVRGTLEQGEPDTASVKPVGIGEVFLIAGHSNAMGLPNLGARDGSNNVVSFSALNKFLNPENITVAPNAPMPAPRFEPLKAEKYIFPSGESAWNWGELGTLLADRLGVPVLFMNAGWAAANSFNWREAAEGKNTRNIYVDKDWPNRQPYSNLINTLRYYHSWLGIRAVLWFHGENDAAHLRISQADYAANIKKLVEVTRKDFGHSMAWVFAHCTVSLNNSETYLPVLNAQIQLAETPGLLAWRGPFTDTIQVPRPNHGHFENVKGGTQGLTQLAQAWNRNLTDAFFAQRPAYAPQAALFAGVVPRSVSPGQAFLLPFRASGSLPASTLFEAQLLNEHGDFVAPVGVGTQSPLRVVMPANLPDGRYRLRILAQQPTLTGNVSDFFRVERGLPSPQLVRSLEIRTTEGRSTVHALVAANTDIVRFTIERSDDRTTFAPIRTLAALPANGSTSILYSFTDPAPSSQTAYYRLRLEKRSGAAEYSNVLAAFRGDSPAILMAFPNPASANEPVFVRTDFPDALTYRLFDTKGSPVPVELAASDIIGLSVLRPAYVLPPGLYLLQITRGTLTQTQRLLIR